MMPNSGGGGLRGHNKCLAGPAWWPGAEGAVLCTALWEIEDYSAISSLGAIAIFTSRKQGAKCTLW